MLKLDFREETPGNPLVRLSKVKESRWNRYRLWQPLSLMVLAGLTPREWEIAIVDENLDVPHYTAMPRPDLVGITGFTSQANRAYELAAEFRQRAGEARRTARHCFATPDIRRTGCRKSIP